MIEIKRFKSFTEIHLHRKKERSKEQLTIYTFTPKEFENVVKIIKEDM